MKYYFLLFFVLSSCQKYDEEMDDNDQLLMSIVAQIGSMPQAAHSRYLGSEVNSISFGEGDQIGVFVGEIVSCWKYELDWGTATPLSWPDKTTSVAFHAYYPYKEKEAKLNNIPMPSLLNQDGTMKNIASRDFMVASTTQSYGENGAVKFTGDNSFKHVSCLIHLVLDKDAALAEACLNKISIDGSNVVASATYSFENSSITLHPEVNENNNTLSINLSPGYTMANGLAFYFILNEKKNDEKVTLTMEYSIGEKHYRATKTDFAGNHFVAGAQQEYSLKMKNDQVIISDASISQWDKGETGSIILNGEEVKL